MKRILFALIALLLSLSAFGQNGKADQIVGTYLYGSGEDAYKVKVVKLADGTYEGRPCWLASSYYADGKVRTDVKNPKKELRSTPLDKIVLFSGLQYDAKKQQWSETKIYDPNRGISAKMTARFEKPGILIIRGTLMGFSESVTWIKQD